MTESKTTEEIRKYIHEHHEALKKLAPYLNKTKVYKYKYDKDWDEFYCDDIDDLYRELFIYE